MDFFPFLQYLIKKMEKKMVHSEKAIVCIGPHDFVLSLMRSMEQDPCPTSHSQPFHYHWR